MWGSIPILMRGVTREQTCWQQHKMAICLPLTMCHKAVLPKARSIPRASQWCIVPCEQLLMQVRDLCMWEMSCHFSPAFMKKLNQHGIDLLHMLIFPLDLPNPLDGTLQTLLGLFGTGDWVCVVFQASILQIQLNFQPFRRTKCESHQTTWLVMLLSTWKHLFSSYHLILFFTSEPCSGSCTGFIV